MAFYRFNFNHDQVLYSNRKDFNKYLIILALILNSNNVEKSHDLFCGKAQSFRMIYQEVAAAIYQTKMHWCASAIWIDRQFSRIHKWTWHMKTSLHCPVNKETKYCLVNRAVRKRIKTDANTENVANWFKPNKCYCKLPLFFLHSIFSLGSVYGHVKDPKTSMVFGCWRIIDSQRVMLTVNRDIIQWVHLWQYFCFDKQYIFNT